MVAKVLRRAPRLASRLVAIVCVGRVAARVAKAARATLAKLAVRLLGGHATKVLAVLVSGVVGDRRVALLGGPGRQSVARAAFRRTPEAAFALAPRTVVSGL